VQLAEATAPPSLHWRATVTLSRHRRTPSSVSITTVPSFSSSATSYDRFLPSSSSQKPHQTRWWPSCLLSAPECRRRRHTFTPLVTGPLRHTVAYGTLPGGYTTPPSVALQRRDLVLTLIHSPLATPCVVPSRSYAGGHSVPCVATTPWAGPAVDGLLQARPLGHCGWPTREVGPGPRACRSRWADKKFRPMAWWDL
jgi:hypothetical protein